MRVCSCLSFAVLVAAAACGDGTVFRRAQIEIESATFEDSAALVDGDTYSLTIRASAGSVLVEAGWSATYTELWAASACGPACRHAQLTPML